MPPYEVGIMMEAESHQRGGHKIRIFVNEFRVVSLLCLDCNWGILFYSDYVESLVGLVGLSLDRLRSVFPSEFLGVRSRFERMLGA